VRPPAPDAPSPALASLPHTRRAILVALKERGEARADELAAALGITVSAVRQHLQTLTVATLVAHREQRGAPGRPKHAYHLTEAGEALFPRAYGELANELLDYLGTEDGLVERLFDQRRRRRVEAARARLAGKSLGDRVAELARILDEEGYLAECEEQPDGSFVLRERNCAILDVACQQPGACASELAFLRSVLPDAEIRRLTHIVAGAPVCAYAIRPAAAPVGRAC
jgi:DeoR family suf operon transcriptional repressor